MQWKAVFLQVQALSDIHGQLMSLLGGLQACHDLQELQRLRDTTSASETRCEELESALGDARFDLQKALSRCDQLEVQLGDALEELRARLTLSASPREEEGGSGGVGGTSSPKGEEKAGEDKSTLSTEEVGGRPVASTMFSILQVSEHCTKP